MVLSAAVGDTVDLVVNIKAPSEPGRYVGYWRLMGPNGKRFGHRFWIDISTQQRQQQQQQRPPSKDPRAALRARFASQVETLKAMGFHAKIDAALDILDEEDGDVQRTVHRLLL